MFSESQVKLLSSAGDFLNSIDSATELNGVGFNKIDKSRWGLYRGNAPMMARVLRKYKKQLTPAFGEELKACFSLVPLTPVLKFVPFENQWGRNIRLEANGYNNIFSQFKDLVKSKGCWFNGPTKQWYIPAKSVKGFDFDTLIKGLVDLGFEIENPEIKDIKEEDVLIEKFESSKDALHAIEQRYNVKVIVIRRLPTKKWEIKFPYNEKIVTLLSNKTNDLSYVTEFNPITKARETWLLECVEEIIEKLKILVPDYQIILDDYQQACSERQERKDRFSKQIPEVSALINPAFALFPHQNENFLFFDKMDGNAVLAEDGRILGDQVGTGKTLSVLSWLTVRKKKTLIVCPKVVRRTWLNEAKKFFNRTYDDLNVYEITAKNKSLPNLSHYQIVSINYEGVKKWHKELTSAGFELLVCDESHLLKDLSTLRTKSVLDISHFFKHKILMSGTAIKNRKGEIYPQTEIAVKGFFKDLDECKKMSIGGLFNKLSSIYIQHRTVDVMKDMPPLLEQLSYIDVENCPDFEDKINFEDIARMKQDVAMAKAPETAKFVQELLEQSDSSILVFSDSLEVCKIIYEKLGKDVAVLHHGQMDDNSRENTKEGWQSLLHEQRVFITTRQSLAVGATLHRADKVVFNDLPWAPADVIQATARAHRFGQIKCVNAYWVVVDGNNWDKKVTGIIQKKYDLCKKINEGRKLSPEEQAFYEKGIEEFISKGKNRV